MKLSVIIPTKDGKIRAKLPEREGVEVVIVEGVSPVGKARNEGLKRATGEYIAWIDADDEVSEDWLEEILSRVDRENGSDVITFDAELVGWGGRGAIRWGVKKPTIEMLLEAVCHDVNRVSALWLYVTKRSLWEKLEFDEKVPIIEDFLLLPDVLKRASSVEYVPKLLYRYFCNPDSLCHVKDPDQERRVIKLKVARRRSFSEGRYRKASQLSLAVAHYLVAVRAMHGVEGYTSEAWIGAAHESERWMFRHLPRALFEIGFRAKLPMIERLAWIFRFTVCAFKAWWLHRRLWRIRVWIGKFI